MGYLIPSRIKKIIIFGKVFAWNIDKGWIQISVSLMLGKIHRGITNIKGRGLGS
jgi:hypothetical protein